MCRPGSLARSQHALKRTPSVSRSSTRCSTTTGRIQPAHLTAALALWDYAQRSAVWALQRSTGDRLAHRIHAALTHQLPGGLTRTQLRDLLHRNPTTTQLDHALNLLADDGKITSSRVLTAGRPAELWTAAAPPGA